jgi:hypothetical protein
MDTNIIPSVELLMIELLWLFNSLKEQLRAPTDGMCLPLTEISNVFPSGCGKFHSHQQSISAPFPFILAKFHAVNQ